MRCPSIVEVLLINETVGTISQRCSLLAFPVKPTVQKFYLTVILDGSYLFDKRENVLHGALECLFVDSMFASRKMTDY
jgi:hypothetical protein